MKGQSMSTKVKKIKALLGFQKTSDADFLKQLNTVHDGLNGNAAYPAPPVDMVTFKKEIDSFTVLVTDAEDGGKKAISAKKKQREAMVKMVTQLGHYVEAACNDDVATFNTSGFVPASTVRAVPAPLSQATIEWIDRGPTTGQVIVKPKTVTKALSYDLRYAPVVNGAAPTTWTTLLIPSPKKTPITNLTAGSTYAFQIRALGKLGYTDWSDSMTFICG
jgi:hypothetical protein